MPMPPSAAAEDSARPKGPLAGGLVADGQRVLPCAEDAAPFGGPQPQLLDWFVLHGENALCCDAHCAAGIAIITNYGGARSAAEFQVRPTTGTEREVSDELVQENAHGEYSA